MVKRIITWNTQGEGLANDEKKQELIDLIRYSVDDENIEPIIFLQEAGELEGLKKRGKVYYGETTLYVDYCMYQLPPYSLTKYEKEQQRRNHRCTLMVLIPKSMRRKVEFADLLYSGYSDRPMLLLDIGTHLLANAHQPAFNQNYAFSCMEMGISNLGMRKKPWILGGDMNCPVDYALKNIPTLRNYSIIEPSDATHDSGSVIDYFVCDSSTKANDIYVVSTTYSDHNIVIMDLE